MNACFSSLAALVCAAALVGCQAPGRSQGPVNQEAIDAAAAGEVKVAKASWWGYDPADATKALQSAIDSGAQKVVVEDMGSPWIVDRIQLASNQEVVFEDRVVIEARRGAFKGTGDCLFTASLKENVTLTGYGATFRMHKADYTGPEYQKAEWRHTLSIRSCTNVKVYGLTLAESGGDGIYLGVSQKGVTNTDVHIKDVVCDRNHRQGISVISAENLLIEDCVLRDTSGTAPQAGIDFEPNDPSEKLVNCVMRNCVSENNRGDGYEFYLKNLHGTSADASIRLENCKSIGGDSVAIRLVTSNGHPDGDLGGLIEFVDCSFERSRNAAISIAEKPAAACRVRFVNCSILHPAAETPPLAPIVFSTRAGDTEAIGGAEFVDCTVADDIDRPPMTFHDFAGGIGVVDVTGTLILGREGKREVTPLTRDLLEAWMPVEVLRKIPPFDATGVRYRPLVAGADADKLVAGTVRLRKAASLVLYAEEGGEVSVTLRSAQVDQYSGSPMPVRVVSASGEQVKAVEAAFLKETCITFLAPETGTFRVLFDTGQNAAQVVSSSHPLCLTSEAQPIHFIGATGEFFFWVPAGVTEFGVKVFGEGTGEGVKAALHNGAGELVEEKDNITRPHLFAIDREVAAAGEVWSLRLSRPSDTHMEDYYVELLGVPPLLASSTEGLLVPAE